MDSTEGDEETLEDDDEKILEDDDTEPEVDDKEEWSAFDKYKVSDDEYDFSEADDEEIVKVYKLLKDDDQVVVTKKDDKVSIKDDETGAEYLIDLGDDDDSADIDLEVDDNDFGASDEFEDAEGLDLENDLENQEDEDMNESRIYEIALNEYDSNVGYTDNYQSKDVMTNPGMSEPGKGNDWDKGVPKGTSKPWSGKKNNKSENQPFTAGKGRTVEEEGDFGDNMPTDTNTDTSVEESVVRHMTNKALQELKTRQEHTANVGSTSRTDGDNGNRRRKGRSYHTAEKGQVTGTVDNPYSKNEDADVNVKMENIMRKADNIFAENKQLKNALMKFKKTLEEAAVTNVNLGNIIKLVTENATSSDEKKEIIARFGNEAKSIKESKNLYNTISNELKKKSKMDINESKELATGNKQINETQIYRSNDILESLDLMHRICK